MTRIDLITGFLGAGKTTFIARYGDWLDRQGVRFAVIENEFGAAGVDRAILSERFGNVGELSGGCICCTLKTGLHAMLAQVAGHCDRVIVEPSGLFNLDDFFEVSDSLAREGLCEMGMCITLIDPHTLPALSAEESMVLHTELTGTGAVLWTKADLAPVPDLAVSAELTNTCFALPAEAPLHFYPTPAHLLTDADLATLQSCSPVYRTHRRVIQNHQALYQSTALRPKGVFDRARLSALLAQLMDDGKYGTLLRVKGFLTTPEGSVAVNCTIAGRTIEPCAAHPAMLNIIGHGIDRAAIRTLLESNAL